MPGVMILAAVILQLQLPGEQARPIDMAVLAALPQDVAQASFHGGTQRCTGPRLDALLASAGVPMGADLRGDALRSVVRAQGADGYAVLFALGDLDPMLGNGRVVIANQCDGQPLAAGDGPLRLLADGDKRGARSVRQLERLEVLTLP